MNAELLRLAKNGQEQKFKKAYNELHKNDVGFTNSDWSSAYATYKAEASTQRRIGSDDSTSAGASGGVAATIEKAIGPANTMVKEIAGGIQTLYKSQIASNTYLSQDLDKVNTLFDMIVNNGINPAKLGYSFLKVAGSEIVKHLQEETDLRYKINSETTLTGELSKALISDLQDANREAIRYGYTIENIADVYTTLVSNTGKLALINKDTIAGIMPVARSLNMTMAEFTSVATDFEKTGIGLDSTTKFLDQLVPKTISLGLSSAKIANDLKTNIGKLNEYGFKNGVDGLTRMVQKSNEFRMSMDSVFSVANKVFSPESAIDLTANLQVLGGAIGAFNDPLKLMYMATNNVEGLQDALIGAAEGLATYNQQQGRFEVTGVNLRRAKEMADQFGISMGELNTIAVAAAERSSASAELFAKGLNVSDEDKEFLTNLSRMKDGKMVITIPDSLAKKLGQPAEIAMENFDETVAKQLLENKKAFEQMSTKDIAMNQLSEAEKMSRDMSVLVSYATLSYARTLKGVVGEANRQEEVENLKTLLKQRSEEFKANTKSAAEQEETGAKFFKAVVEPIKEGRLQPDAMNMWKKLFETETPTTSQAPSITRDDMTRAFTDAMVATRGGKTPVVINTNVSEENPNSYTYKSVTFS